MNLPYNRATTFLLCGVPFFLMVHWPPAHKDKVAEVIQVALYDPVNMKK